MIRPTVGAALLALALAVPAAADTTSSPRPEPVELGGTPVSVSSNPSDPVVLRAGLWADTLTGPGEPEANAHWFRYERTMQYSSVLVGAVASSTVANDAVAVSVFAPDGTDCGSATGNASAQTLAAVFGARVDVPDDEPGDTVDPCVRAPHLDLKVTRGSSSDPGDLPIAIRLVEEAPVNVSAQPLPEALEVPTVPRPPTGDPEALAGGTSFDDAPELTSGQTVSDRVPEGTERLFRVRLGWGEALAVAVDVPAQDEAATAALDFVSPSVTVRLLDPQRVPFDTGHPESVDGGTYSDEPAALFDGTLPVNLANRFAGDASTSVPGDYWVAVSVATPSDPARATVDVPVEVTAAVTSTPGERPRFAGRVLSADGDGDGPQGYTADTPYLVGDGVFSADVSGTPTAPGDQAAAGSDGRRVAGFAVGAASLVSLLAGAVLLRRRARLSRAATR